jgi:thiol-disulfide isomerase/thioredoxin
VTRLALVLLLLVACRTPAPPEVAILPEIVPLEGGAPPPSPSVREPEVLPDATLAPGDIVGQRAPGFDLAPAVGKQRVAAYRDRVTLVYFWATWCVPCRDAFPLLDALYRKHRARGFVVAALSVDDEDGDLENFATHYKVSFPIGWDRDHTLAERYLLSRMPTHILVDRDGVIRQVYDGYRAGDVDRMAQEIEKLL